MVISEMDHESDPHSDKIKPFSRPMSGITLERTVLPGIEKNTNNIK